MCLKNVSVNSFGCLNDFMHTAQKTSQACQSLGDGWKHVSNDESCIAARDCNIQAPIHGNCYDNHNGFSYTHVCYSWYETGGNPKFWCTNPNGEIWSGEKCMYSWNTVRAYSSFPQGCVHYIE